MRSVRFSGTRQQACGRILSAMSSMASVAAISKLSGFVDRRLEAAHVVVVNVPAVLAQMRGDAVGAGFDREQRRADGIGDRAAARVADGRDMIDVDAKPKRCHRAAPLSDCAGQAAPASARLPGLTAGSAASSGGSASGG